MKNLTDNFARNVKRIRRVEGLTQAQFGANVDLPQKTIGAIEEGRALGIDSVYKISRAYGYTIDQLLTEEI